MNKHLLLALTSAIMYTSFWIECAQQNKKRKFSEISQNDTNSKAVGIRLIYDNFTERRGNPKIIHIHCRRCDHKVIKYQKDGPGRLLRCYLDRIHEPSQYKEDELPKFDVNKSADFRCGYCDSILGSPMIYTLYKENRPAYKLYEQRIRIAE